MPGPRGIHRVLRAEVLFEAHRPLDEFDEVRRQSQGLALLRWARVRVWADLARVLSRMVGDHGP